MPERRLCLGHAGERLEHVGTRGGLQLPPRGWRRGPRLGRRICGWRVIMALRSIGRYCLVIFGFGVVAAALFALTARTASASTNECGALAAPESWTAAGSPYVVCAGGVTIGNG